MHVLVTGGAGFIGSHASLRLLDAGHTVTIVDILDRGHREAAEALRSLAPGRCHFVEGDLNDTALLTRALAGVDLVMHFAALAYVGESVDVPLRYYRANTAGTTSLLLAMDQAGVRRLVFSSTCATYGEPPPERIPIVEECPQQPVNPYGRSKLMCEAIIKDWAFAHERAKDPVGYAFLRYFNVAGSDADCRVGEDHRPETHLIPICLEVALGQRQALTIFGDDWATPDGTCVRDYVHVDDLVSAHVLVAERLVPGSAMVYNVGTGQGASVREVLETCRRVTGRPIAATMGARRAGDPPALVGSPAKILRELGWKAKHTSLASMVESAWRWRCKYPHGWKQG